MKKALISGVTGQDGSYLAELLIKKGYLVHGIVRRSSSFNTGRIDHLINDKKYHEKFLFHHGDITDASNLNRLLKLVEPDEIYNLAAQSHVKVSFDIPDYTAQVDALENQPFGAFAEAFDPEGLPVTYAITGGTDQGLFEINASSGVVSFNSPADFENPNDADGDNRYEVQVLAQCNSQSLAQNYLIQVVDVQDSTLPANGKRHRCHLRTC